MADSAETSLPPAAPEPSSPVRLPPAAPDLLDRPQAQRTQEFKYRFAQSVVFGLPVIALQAFGRSLGGAEADLWVGLFQALLAGWVLYVGATGMLSEAVLLALAGRRANRCQFADLAAASGALLLYLAGVPRLVGLLVARPRAVHWPAAFHLCVALLALWTGLRWWQASRKTRPA